MPKGNWARNLIRVAIILYLIGVHVVLAYLLIDNYVLRNAWKPESINVSQIEPAPIPSPKPESTPVPLPQTHPETAPTPAGIKLIIPVQGAAREDLIDTFSQARTEGRIHDAIDIPAALGTPVVAASDGEIVKFHDSEQGGISIYQLTANRKYFFYYAHLQRRDERIAEKQFVTSGTVIGYVGDTGNAGTGNYHLHFAINVAVDPNRFWEGFSIDPYKVLKGEAVLQ